MDVGQRGISIAALTKHVYNMNSTFFYQPDIQKINVFVRQYVWRNSRSAHPMIEHMEKRGYYRLKKNRMNDVQQMILCFSNDDKREKADDTANKAVADLSLSLFSDEEMKNG